MNEMIERVGNAMAYAVALNYDNNKAIFDLYAKVAIIAMREPTEEMTLEGSKHVVIFKHANAVYQAMIDKALEE